VSKNFQVAVVNLRKAIITPAMPLQQSARNTSVPVGQIFLNSFISSFFTEVCREKFKFVASRTKNFRTFMSSLVTNAKEPQVFGCADFDSECVHFLVRTEAEGAVERGTCNTAQHKKVAVHL